MKIFSGVKVEQTTSGKYRICANVITPYGTVPLCSAEFSSQDAAREAKRALESVEREWKSLWSKIKGRFGL